ncbi:hypothetical protein BDF19DRAFT_435921 [Syncephalis fuscata]|nr:hypothetical protein BDF19DRAFT_435921 [Syncephalis fuscata]
MLHRHRYNMAVMSLQSISRWSPLTSYKRCARFYSGQSSQSTDHSSLPPQLDGHRAYYYYLNEHGLLFLHDTWPRNIATCFKDKRFLDTFFRMLRSNTTQKISSPYDYISPCGREWNFLSCQDTPVVYYDLSSDGKLLSWAGSLTEPFQLDKICLSRHTGRLYHPLPSMLNGRGLPAYALLHSSLVLSHLYDGLSATPSSDKQAPFKLEYRNQIYHLKYFQRN